MTTTDQPTPAQARPQRSKIVEAVAAIADRAKSVAACPANKRGDFCEYCERDAKEALAALDKMMGRG